ncbi:hypothetical protein [Sedimentisphaera salicampi]|uniref:hypothetical protein n=1 Tax=Sedimentisphaera salicampi TaxID=1941349 RepID=UPI000B9D1B4A|nr:hypothetical protein [Sedimentisphaera salicampi]OXU14943.1 hypothetical protein SMSP1_01440 [Sedimentisphaera salicampi]
MENPFFIELLEAGMVVCFGAAWPISIHKSITSKTSKGKSFVFLLVIFAGYILGVSRKVITDTYSIAFYAYCLNLLMVGADSMLWLINHHRHDKKAQS